MKSYRLATTGSKTLLLISALLLTACMGNTRPIDAWPFPVPPSAPGQHDGGGSESEPQTPGETPPPLGHPLPLPLPPPPTTADAPPPLLNSFPRSIEGSGVAAPVLALVKQSRVAKGQKNFEQSEAALERALRIEPRNPWIWQQLASLHLLTGRNEQALTESKKSNSLAHRNPWIEVESYRVMAAAASALGNGALSSQAQARYEDRQRWITTPPFATPNTSGK